MEAEAIGKSIDDLADFRPMFDIGSCTDAGARRGATGLDVFMGGAIAKDYVPEEVETCISGNWLTVGPDPKFVKYERTLGLFAPTYSLSRSISLYPNLSDCSTVIEGEGQRTARILNS